MLYSWPLHTRDWGPMAIVLQALSLVEKVELVQVRFTLRLTDQQSKWTQDGCKVYMDYYIPSNGSCLMVTWMISENHLLKVGLTQTHETMHSGISKQTVDLFYLSMCQDPIWINSHGNNIWLRARDHITWFRKCLWDGFWTRPFGFSQFRGHGSWLVSEAALTIHILIGDRSAAA
jgi:hypothetical protein